LLSAAPENPALAPPLRTALKKAAAPLIVWLPDGAVWIGMMGPVEAAAGLLQKPHQPEFVWRRLGVPGTTRAHCAVQQAKTAGQIRQCGRIAHCLSCRLAG
jgi:hypothetical protein